MDIEAKAEKMKEQFGLWVDGATRMARTGQGVQKPSDKLTMWRNPGTPLNMERLFFSNVETGASAFLICSGPSTQAQDLSLLRARGIVTMALNNSWALLRPDLWVAVDPPGSFCDGGWKDPGIMKFVPMPLYSNKLRLKYPNGSFGDSRFGLRDMPNCVFFPRNADFNHSTFLTEPSVNWGNHEKQKDSLGHGGARSVMLAGLRILHHLGFRRVYLVGADFKMSDGIQNYAFPQERGASSVRGNNKTYEILKDRFRALQPHFIEHRFRVINCTPNSNLDVFESMDYLKAVEEATIIHELDTEGWYGNMRKPKPNIPAGDMDAPEGPAPLSPEDIAELRDKGCISILAKMGVDL